MIRRTPNKNPHYSIACGPIDDAELSWQARGLLVYLLSKKDDFEVSIEQLTKASPDGVTVVRSCLRELATLGYARLEQKRSTTGHRARGKHWNISELPFSDLQESYRSERDNNGVEFSDIQETCRSENSLTFKKPVGQKKPNKQAVLSDLQESYRSENLKVRKPVGQRSIYDKTKDPDPDLTPLPSLFPNQDLQARDKGGSGGETRSKTPAALPLSCLEKSAAIPQPKKQPTQPTKPRPAPPTPLPTDFTLTDRMRAWGQERFPTVDLDKTTEAWMDGMLAKGHRYLNWEAAWRNGIRHAVEWKTAVMHSSAKAFGDMTWAEKFDYLDRKNGQETTA